MIAHLRQFKEAYFTGLLFALLQYSLAADQVPGPAHHTTFAVLRWLMRLSTVALPTLLAFLNGSVQRGRQNVPPPPPETKPIDLPLPLFNSHLERINLLAQAERGALHAGELLQATPPSS